VKTLIEDDLLGFETVKKVLYARLDREGSVSLGDRYRVPKEYFPSGVAEVTNIDGVRVMNKNGTEKDSYWFVDLEAVIAEPEDPCDSDFMEEISS
jgi:hypothetical protein